MTKQLIWATTPVEILHHVRISNAVGDRLFQPGVIVLLQNGTSLSGRIFSFKAGNNFGQVPTGSPPTAYYGAIELTLDDGSSQWIDFQEIQQIM
ncbi:MAG: hypothetical protein WCF20_02475 [Methylovirgula sp.]